MFYTLYLLSSIPAVKWLPWGNLWLLLDLPVSSRTVHPAALMQHNIQCGNAEMKDMGAAGEQYPFLLLAF